MRVGFTYDLRDDYLREGYDEEETAEFDSPVTIDAIERALSGLGHEVTRIGHIRALSRRLLDGERWDLVFNIAEGLEGMGREAQVPCLLDAYRIPYTFSDPLVLALTLHKGMAKRVARDAGVATPDFAVVEDVEDIAAVRLPFPVFCKPVAEGTGKGIGAASRVTDAAGLDRVCRDLLARFRQPVLVEAFLPGREFTVGIWGTRRKAESIAVLEVSLNARAEQDAYGYENKEHFEDRVVYRLVDDAEAREAGRVALAAWRALGCRDGGRVDLRSDADGHPAFLEVNPLAGLNPVRSDLPILCRQAGISYETLIGRIVESAQERLPANKRA